MGNRYHFLTRWRVHGTIEEVFDLIGEPLDYPRWWPSVYLAVDELALGDAGGAGRRIRYVTKGWLPYTLRWQSEVTAIDAPRSLAIRALGDLDGRGEWRLEQDGTMVNASFDWEIVADKPLLRALSPLLKPAFEANHRWAMEQGRISLALELERRHAQTAIERLRIPDPPGPNRTSGFYLAAGALAALGIAVVALREARRRS
jgi:uncharacterized protein YndB with AHSA1/START domain